MENGKKFIITPAGVTEQFISASSALGLILNHPGVDEMVGNFGSRVKRSYGNTTIDIVPPIPLNRLDELGAALVKLATKLDPSPPPPTYKIMG